MEIRYFQKGFNYSQDGPGNRLVVHLQGCNLHCPWCSNPEGMRLDGGKTTDTECLAQEILSCKRLFFDGGGVTFTGGECTLQKSALKDVLVFCKNHGIHTAIETNATCPYDRDFFDKIDFLICDFKHYDKDKLQKFAGAGTKNYTRNVQDYLESGKNILIRILLINGFNASDDDARPFAEFFKNLPTENAAFEFLSYHEYGKAKWEKLGKEYKMNPSFVSMETVTKFEEVFRSCHLKTIRS